MGVCNNDLLDMDTVSISYRKIMRSLDGIISAFRVFQSPWNLAAVSAACLPKRPSNLWTVVTRMLSTDIAASMHCEILREDVLLDVVTASCSMFVMGQLAFGSITHRTVHVFGRIVMMRSVTTLYMDSVTNRLPPTEILLYISADEIPL